MIDREPHTHTAAHSNGEVVKTHTKLICVAESISSLCAETFMWRLSISLTFVASATQLKEMPD